MGESTLQLFKDSKPISGHDVSLSAPGSAVSDDEDDDDVPDATGAGAAAGGVTEEHVLDSKTGRVRRRVVFGTELPDGDDDDVDDDDDDEALHHHGSGGDDDYEEDDDEDDGDAMDTDGSPRHHKRGRTSGAGLDTVDGSASDDGSAAGDNDGDGEAGGGAASRAQQWKDNLLQRAQQSFARRVNLMEVRCTCSLQLAA